MSAKNLKINRLICIFLAVLFVMLLCIFSYSEISKTSYAADGGAEDNGGFDVVRNTLVRYTGKATSVTIPSYIETIAAGAFKNNTTVVDILVNINTKTIEQNAFYGCSNIKNITIPETSKLETIGFMAFGRCGTLREISLPSKLKQIGAFAFFACSQLKDLVIPESVTDIGEYAFMSCINIAEFNITANVKQIGKGAFNYCIKNTAINVAGGNRNFYSSNGVLYTKDRQTLLRYPAGKKLASFTVDVPVKNVAQMAFWDNRYLTDLTFPSTLNRWESGSINDRSQNSVLKTIHAPSNAQLQKNQAKACKDCPSLSVIYGG